jgi:hypothetical protein
MFGIEPGGRGMSSEDAIGAGAAAWGGGAVPTFGRGAGTGSGTFCAAAGRAKAIEAQSKATEAI